MTDMDARFLWVMVTVLISFGYGVAFGWFASRAIRVEKGSKMKPDERRYRNRPQ